MVLGVAWWLPRSDAQITAGEARLPAEFAVFFRHEAMIAAEQRRIDRMRAMHQITSKEWAHRVQVSILPKWQATEDELSKATESLPQRYQPLRSEMLQYLDQKRLGLDLLSDGARNDDMEKLDWAMRVLKRNAAEAKNIQREIRDLK